MSGEYISISKSEWEALLKRLNGLEQSSAEKDRIIPQQSELISQLRKENEGLKRENEKLRNRLNLNSSNSHKPPSTDGFKKKAHSNNSRTPSTRKPGAQPGHQGKTLLMTDEPDVTLKVEAWGRCDCGRRIEHGFGKGYERQQVLDLASRLVEITEILAEKKQCACGRLHTALTGATTGIQYGPRIRSLAVYLRNQQHLPYERLRQTLRDCLGLQVSAGFVADCIREGHGQLKQTEDLIKEALKNAHVCHFDETGINVSGKVHWVHTAGTGDLTLYKAHAKRGREAMNDIGVLADLKGVAVHDRFASYDIYECGHALCNAHLQRDLKSVLEQENRPWAQEMLSLLLDAKACREEGRLDAKMAQEINLRYDNLVREAMAQEEKLQPPQRTGRGRKAKTKSMSLLTAFSQRKDEILHFVRDAQVPYDNNLAERDVRMIKAQQKISGGFRTVVGLERFCRIRSYISTARKQNQNIMQAIRAIFTANPANFLKLAE